MPLTTAHPPAETEKVIWYPDPVEVSGNPAESKLLTTFIPPKYVKSSNIADFSPQPCSQPQTVLHDYSPTLSFSTKRDWLYWGPCVKQTVRSHPHFSLLHYVHLPERPALLNQGCKWRFSEFPLQSVKPPFPGGGETELELQLQPQHLS